MRTAAFVSAVLALLFCVSCEKDSPSGPNVRQVWTITLGGDLSGGGDMTILENGTFNDTWNMRVSSRTYATRLTGTVSDSGTVTGAISIQGSIVGDIAGYLGASTGSGTYYLTQPSVLNGTWNAVKN